MDSEIVSAFFDDSPVAFAILGENLRVVQANAAFKRLLQETRSEDVFETAQIGEVFTACKAVLKGEATRIVGIKAGDRDVEGCLSAEIFCLRLGKGKAVGVVLKKTERSLEELERTLRARASQVQELHRDMDAYSYSVSHDLRAPVRAVIGFSQALQHELAASLQGKSKEYLTRVRQSAERMSELMDHLLRLSRAARQEPVEVSVNLTELVRMVARTVASQDPDRTVTWVIQESMTARSDEKYLRETLEILLANALKFTRGKADARIEVGSRAEHEEIQFYVRDNGVGYDPEYAGRLFAPFQRLHSPDDFPGEGMGLVIARKLVQRMGGRIWAETDVGQGATFFFTLG